MDHSAFDAYAFHIRNGEKSVVYTGDFRNHGRKSPVFERFLEKCPKDIDGLFIEGTMLSRQSENVKTESDLEMDVVEISKNTEGLLMAYTSSQNIDRLVTLYRAAKRTNRTFVIDIYTAHMLHVASQNAKIPNPSDIFPDVKVYYPFRMTKRIADLNKQKLLYEFVSKKISKEEIKAQESSIMLLVKPSSKIDIAKIGVGRGSALIYSLWAGYLREDYTSSFIDWIKEKSVEVHHVHTSGHATVDALKKTITELAPRTILPIHSSCPDVYKTFFSNVATLQDNQEFSL